MHSFQRFRQLILLSWMYFRDKGIGAFFRKVWAQRHRYHRSSKLSPIVIDFSQHWEPLCLGTSKTPQISIIIPVFNQSIFTFNCLKSIHENTDGMACEVIVVDDGSTDDTSEMVQSMEGVRYLKNEKNIGFVGSCNAGAKAAQGEFLVFLNNDTMVTDGWLDAMLQAHENHDNVGLVGAKLLFPDGRLQEAGGMIWQDGSAANIGKWENPEEPTFNYLRQVDYCSGACLLIKKNLFDELGGFDQQYAPAYYEDTDLAMAVRHAGFKVIYQPLARVVHFEGQTCGVDTSQGMKRYQAVNREKFRSKWQEQLTTTHLPVDSTFDLHLDRHAAGRILVVENMVPTPDRDSGSLRLFSLIEMMVSAGWQVIFWPHSLEYQEGYTEKLQQLGVLVYYGRHSFEKEIRRIGPGLDAAWICRPHFAGQYMDSIKRHSSAKLIYDTVDLHYIRESRRATVENCKGAEQAAKRWKKIELELAETADLVIAISPEEKQILSDEGFTEKLILVPNVHEIEPDPQPFSERNGLMFIGNFLHPPNGDAVIWFVREVLPIIREKHPDIELVVVGNKPPREIVDLQDNTITVTGYVPDVKPYFDQARVFVAPLRYGAGLKGKIGQSLAFGLPVVTTSIGAEGFPVSEEGSFFIADKAEDFASKVITLYDDEKQWERMSSSGYQLIEDTFSAKSIKPALSSLLNEMESG